MKFDFGSYYYFKGFLNGNFVFIDISWLNVMDVFLYEYFFIVGFIIGIFVNVVVVIGWNDFEVIVYYVGKCMKKVWLIYVLFWFCVDFRVFRCLYFSI